MGAAGTRGTYGAAARLGDHTGQQLGLRPRRLHVLAVLLTDLQEKCREREDGKTRTCRPWDPLWDPASGVTQMAPHLVPHLQHLLRVGVEGHKLVGVLDADGGATAALLHLISLQPLRGAEGGTPRDAWHGEQTQMNARHGERKPQQLHIIKSKPQQMHGTEGGNPEKCMAWKEESTICAWHGERKPQQMHVLKRKP